MKKIYILTLSLIFTLFNTSAAQTTCCMSSTVAPEITTGSNTAYMNINTPASVLSVNASTDLPNTEYIITKRGTPALTNTGTPNMIGGGGDVIVGTDDDGSFLPSSKSRYGISLQEGDSFNLTAVGYDLQLIKTLTDSLLKGTSGGNPCCNLFLILSLATSNPALAGFCDTLSSHGIFSGADVNNFNDVITVFEALSTSQYSVPALIAEFQNLNNYGNYISTDCGGTGANDFIPFGINPTENYSYLIKCLNNNVATDSISSCVTHTWIDGNTYTSSNNTATYALQDFAGCDSLITLNLTIRNASASTDSIVSCTAYTWMDSITYTTDNNSATYTLTNAAGCDSVVTLNLKLHNNINPNFSTVQQVFTSPPFSAVFNNNTANSAGYNFTWDFGDTTIIQDNSATVNHVYTNAGLYDVTLIAEEINSGCADTLTEVDYISCTVNTIKINQSTEINASPNPTEDNISIILSRSHDQIVVRTFNLTGQLMDTAIFENTDNFDIKIKGQSGFYIMEILLDEKISSVIKVTKL